MLCCLVCICAACLPCALGWCQDTDHICTACNKKVTHKPHDGQVQVMHMQSPMEPSRYAIASQYGAGVEKPRPAAGPTEYQQKVEAYRQAFDGRASDAASTGGNQKLAGQK